jgi:hypothetical protein
MILCILYCGAGTTISNDPCKQLLWWRQNDPVYLLWSGTTILIPVNNSYGGGRMILCIYYGAGTTILY